MQTFCTCSCFLPLPLLSRRICRSLIPSQGLSGVLRTHGLQQQQEEEGKNSVNLPLQVWERVGGNKKLFLHLIVISSEPHQDHPYLAEDDQKDSYEYQDLRGGGEGKREQEDGEKAQSRECIQHRGMHESGVVLL